MDTTASCCTWIQHGCDEFYTLHRCIERIDIYVNICQHTHVHMPAGQYTDKIYLKILRRNQSAVPLLTSRGASPAVLTDALQIEPRKPGKLVGVHHRVTYPRCAPVSMLRSPAVRAGGGAPPRTDRRFFQRV